MPKSPWQEDAMKKLKPIGNATGKAKPKPALNKIAVGQKPAKTGSAPFDKLMSDNSAKLQQIAKKLKKR